MLCVCPHHHHPQLSGWGNWHLGNLGNSSYSAQLSRTQNNFPPQKILSVRNLPSCSVYLNCIYIYTHIYIQSFKLGRFSHPNRRTSKSQLRYAGAIWLISRSSGNSLRANNSFCADQRHTSLHNHGHCQLYLHLLGPASSAPRSTEQ